jgi:hypothetical protein
LFEYADRWMTEDDSRHRATIKSQISEDYRASRSAKPGTTS